MAGPEPHMATVIMGAEQLWGKCVVGAADGKGRVDSDILVGGKPTEQRMAPSII